MHKLRTTPWNLLRGSQVTPTCQCTHCSSSLMPSNHSPYPPAHSWSLSTNWMLQSHLIGLHFKTQKTHWLLLGCWGYSFFSKQWVNVTLSDMLVILVILEQLARGFSHIISSISSPFSFSSSPSPVGEPKITEQQCLTVITPSLLLWRAAQWAAHFHPSRSFQPTSTVSWHVHEESGKSRAKSVHLCTSV